MFDELLGNGELESDQIQMLQQTIRSSGAVDRIEEMISRNTTRAETALDFAPIDANARNLLLELAHKAARRFA